MKTRIIISLVGIMAFLVLLFTSGIFTPIESELSECSYTDGKGLPRPCKIIDGWYDALFYSEPSPLDEPESNDAKLLERFRDSPEVGAFYAKYEDTSASVRDDHVSYVTGSDDGFKVRMNLYFDENYELDYFTLRCYVDRELQDDVAETFIQKYLQKFECEKRPEPVNEQQENLTLYVSNQSFENSPVDITVMIDGKILVDRNFDVGNQHVYIDYNFLLDEGTHTIHAKSVAGQAELEEEFEIDEQKWAVLSYWYYPDDPDFESPHFDFVVYDTPVGFA